MISAHAYASHSYSALLKLNMQYAYFAFISVMLQARISRHTQANRLHHNFFFVLHAWHITVHVVVCFSSCNSDVRIYYIWSNVSVVLSWIYIFFSFHCYDFHRRNGELVYRLRCHCLVELPANVWCQRPPCDRRTRTRAHTQWEATNISYFTINVWMKQLWHIHTLKTHKLLWCKVRLITRSRAATIQYVSVTQRWWYDNSKETWKIKFMTNRSNGIRWELSMN